MHHSLFVRLSSKLWRPSTQSSTRIPCMHGNDIYCAYIFHSFCSPPYLLTVFVGEQAFLLAFGQVVKDI